MNMKDLTVLPLPLGITERQELERYEGVIYQGLQVFYAVGTALVEIKNRKLYRADYGTFEDYCRERWNISRHHANRLIDSVEIVDNLVTNSALPLPEHESQARELKGLEPDQQRQVWQKAIDTAPNGKVTAQHIKDVRQAEIPIPEPEPVTVAAPVQQVSVDVTQAQLYCIGCGQESEDMLCPTCVEERYQTDDDAIYPPAPDDPHYPSIDKENDSDLEAVNMAELTDDEPADRAPEAARHLCATCDTVIVPELQQEVEGKFYHPNCTPKAPKPSEPATKICMFCGARFAPAELYCDTVGAFMAICQACASKALHLLSEDDVFAWHTEDRERICNAGLRIFRVAWGDPRENRLEIREYLPPKGSSGSHRSWQIVERFTSKADLKRRIKELDQDELTIFEHRSS